MEVARGHGVVEANARIDAELVLQRHHPVVWRVALLHHLRVGRMLLAHRPVRAIVVV